MSQPLHERVDVNGLTIAFNKPVEGLVARHWKRPHLELETK